MTCGGCVSCIQNALNTHSGINNATADLETVTVSVDFDPTAIATPSTTAVIEDAGFDVVAD